MPFLPSPLSPLADLGLMAGEDKSFTLRLNPRRSITGWSLKFTALGRTATITFPPLTLPWWDPCIQVFVPNNLAVIPGVQPPLPTSGACYSITKDNLAIGGVVIADATYGIITVSLVSGDTINNPPDLYAWSLLRVDGGLKTLLLAGSLAILGNP